MNRMKLILTCEHGGNQIPPEHQSLFEGHEALLNSHRGFDLGALNAARRLADRFSAPLFYSTTSRLLVDLNRSRSHPHLFSEITKPLPTEVKEAILLNYYNPYRGDVEKAIGEAFGENKAALHISVHSFTPIWEGLERKADIGILYDPSRAKEKQFARRWQRKLREIHGDWVVRRNDPYRGKADGFVTHLRRRFSPHEYVGIELEINQKSLVETPEKRQDLVPAIASSLQDILLNA
ncbi:MAG: N-formylglutamate amidohydrolase [Candidatus Omnitrophica bacterium]|nr:N-formylglutamate amidohydrolase [Candidatus Omnitrophota bacterium]